jgi:hypothetical protein
MDNFAIVPPSQPHGRTSRWQQISLLVAALGLVITVVGAFLDRTQFWQSYLLAFFFWLEIALGALGWLMLQYLVGGRWSVHIRRLLETGTMTLPLMLLLFIPLLFGLTTLYPWTNAVDFGSESKQLYLNLPFFIGRAILYFAVWLGLAMLLKRWSPAIETHADGEPLPQSSQPQSKRLRRVSAVGLILYMLTATFAGYDWLMSLEPAWFSSIYGLLVIAGQALAALAVAIIGLRLTTRESAVSITRSVAFNDLGNFMLAFVMIWAYLTFSQFLIIWSANLPEEAIWYVHRSQGGWLSVGMGLVALHFVIPFFLLLSRRVKRQAQMLTVLAVLILIARWVDLVWLIVPAFYPGQMHFHWLDGVIVVAMGGGWVAFFLRQWSNPLVTPASAPRGLPPV